MMNCYLRRANSKMVEDLGFMHVCGNNLTTSNPNIFKFGCNDDIAMGYHPAKFDKETLYFDRVTTWCALDRGCARDR